MHPQSKLLALLLGLAVVSAANAASVLSYSDATAFQSTLQSGSYLENFDGSISGTTSQVFSFGSYSYTATASSNLIGLTGDLGSQYLTTQEQGLLTLTFTSGAPTAIGGFFFDNEINGNFMAGDLSIALSDGTNYSFHSAAIDSTPFLGFTTSAANPIAWLTISTSTTGGYVGVDNLVVGQVAIPEPSTYALGVGVLALGFAFWRRRR